MPIDLTYESVSALPALVANVVRSVDVVWDDAANLYIVMPETSRDHARQAMARVASRIPVLQVDRVRVAVFPDDASTAGELLDVLSGSETEHIVVADLVAGASATAASR